jgi:hypothetical protein
MFAKVSRSCAHAKAIIGGFMDTGITKLKGAALTFPWGPIVVTRIVVLGAMTL